MKKVAITLVANLVCLIAFSQTNEIPQRLKYVTTAPDGSVAMTIYDDTREDSMTLESANSFYRFEILDTATSEPVYTSRNKGKACTIDKNKLDAGTYNLRLYTSNFVITSEITISGTHKLNKAFKQENTLANND
jgi:hypothetical protein